MFVEATAHENLARRFRKALKESNSTLSYEELSGHNYVGRTSLRIPQVSMTTAWCVILTKALTVELEV